MSFGKEDRGGSLGHGVVSQTQLPREPEVPYLTPHLRFIIIGCGCAARARTRGRGYHTIATTRRGETAERRSMGSPTTSLGAEASPLE